MPNYSNEDLFEMLRLKSATPNSPLQPGTTEFKRHLLDRILVDLSLKEDEDEEFEKNLWSKVSSFCCTVDAKWKKANRGLAVFQRQNSDWLANPFLLPTLKKKDARVHDTSSTPSTSVGRPSKEFSDCSDRAKRRKIEQLRENVSTEELAFATKCSLNEEGKRSAAKLIADATEYSPGRPLKIRRILKKSESSSGVTPYTSEEALAYMIKCRLTKDAYIQTRVGAKKRGADIYPSYEHIKAAKKQCYPEEGITIDHIGATVSLQSLLDHTLNRLLKLVDTPDSNEYEDFVFICKWGCDGSSAHSEYRQVWNSETPESSEADDSVTDANLFLVSLVPLQLMATKKSDQSYTYFWKNPCPSSTRYCRPIRFRYVKETTEVTEKEVGEVQDEIADLKPLIFQYAEETVEIKYQLLLTMIDGKVANALTHTSSQSCYICGALPSQMNDLKRVEQRQIREDHLQYGMSTLHARIKILELVLHVSYKPLDYDRPTKRGATHEERRVMDERKKDIQNQLWKRLGLRVDKVVRQGGLSNTGNTARRFFDNINEVAEIIGFDKQLLKDFKVILTVISCGRQIDPEKFRAFSRGTAERFVNLYSHRMPPTIHKILVHGDQIIKHYGLLPIGDLSEEAQEARNKDYKRIRERHTRKSSHKKTTEDLINMLLVTSDPVISSLLLSSQKETQPMPASVAKLLKEGWNEAEEIDELPSPFSSDFDE